ncbi:hypothetical protein K2X05_03380, partial [bacterium]|nr:hypothetical protein [bacterium]
MQNREIKALSIFEEVLPLFGRVLGRSAPVVFPIALVLQLGSQLTQYFGQMDSDVIRVFSAINQFLLTGLLWPTLFILIVPVYGRDVEVGAEKTDLFRHLKKHFSQLVIESLRVIGRVTLSAVIWLIPGLVLLAIAVRVLALQLPSWVWIIAIGILVLPVIY